MIMENNDTDNENKLLQNALLLTAIRKNKIPEEKIKRITKCLNEGADINAVDANDKHNTPLHVAVSKGEIEVVEILLNRGAIIDRKNSKNETALDIAIKTETHNGLKIADVLKSHLQENQAHSDKQNQLLLADKQHKDKNQCPQENIQLYYQKRSGTSGLGGQLYETKLLSLILLRALYDYDIVEFYLGANVLKAGYFGDIVLRYKKRGFQKSRVIFMQVKHKEDPTKEKVTVEEVLKLNGNFSLYRHFCSYLKEIKDSFSDDDCEFIFLTSAIENFTKKKIVDQADGTSFLKSNREGTIFQFDYDQQDIAVFVYTMSMKRALELSRSVCAFILKDNNNYNDMMNGIDNTLKTYHVFLAHNVIDLETVPQDSKSSYCLGKFRQTFLTSNTTTLICIKNYILRSIQYANISKSSNEQIKIETLTFKLPLGFGNAKFILNESDDLCSKFQILLQNAYENLEYKVVKIDNDMIGPEKVLQYTHVGTKGLGGLVGNLLIFDEDTKLLKFDLNKQNLSVDNIKILDRLQNWFVDLGSYRFDINICDFPKLTLALNNHETSLLKEFLSRVKFYTNQPKEDEVENIVKEEIDNLFCIRRTQNESMFRIKCDTIFLKVHDQVQKWWQSQNHQAPYLTKTCKFFEEAGENILHTPMLSFLNIIYRENIKKIMAVFELEVINSLNLADFFKCGERILLVFSDETDFSSMKVIQVFDEIQLDQGYQFIDLDFVILENYFEVLQSELNKSKLWVLTVVCQGNGDTKKLNEKINIISKEFKGIIIIITGKTFGESLKLVLAENIIHVEDTRHNFRDLAANYQEKMFLNRRIIFQGYEFNLGELLDSDSLHFIKTDIMRKIICNVKIEIGQPLTNPSYNTISDFYINQSLFRCVTVDSKNIFSHDFYVIHNAATEHDFPQGKEDVIVLTESEVEYEDVCMKYVQHNVHWFICEDSCYTWKKSKGSLKTLLPYVRKGLHNGQITRPQTLKDIKEKIIIISAEPGMGKSTFLTHLAIQTKRLYPKLWISKINLLEHIDQFSKWKEDKTNINMDQVIKFLYRVIMTKDNGGGIKNTKNVWDNIITDICMDDKNKICFLNIKDNKDLNGLDYLELNLFNHFYNNNLVALLFDGFDEICPDYTNEVLQLLCTLKTSKVAHLWVTTRSYNVLEQLESVLGTFSYTLQALTKAEQSTFLQKIWSSKLGLYDVKRMNKCVANFFQIISFVLRDDERSFTSLPLHLYMVSEVFQDFFRNFYDPTLKKVSNLYMELVMKSFNLINLYELFVDMKFFKIRFGEKKHFMCFKDPDLRKMVENERKYFLESHKKAGAYFLLAKSVVTDLCSEKEIEEVHEFIDSVRSGEEKSGIIERMVGDDPKFVHLTFAEYFATEFLFDKFQSGSCTTALQKYVINVIFLTDKGGVRRFINSKLIKDKKLFDLSTDTSNICTVFGSLVTRNFLPTNSFFLASEEYLNHIAMFMLICAGSAYVVENISKYMRLFKSTCTARCDLCAIMRRKMSYTKRDVNQLVVMLRRFSRGNGW